MMQRIVSVETRREAVLRLLQDGRWHPTSEIIHPAFGGSEGMRRLRELRALGYTIEMQKHAGHDDYEYKLVSVTDAIRRRRHSLSAHKSVEEGSGVLGGDWGADTL